MRKERYLFENRITTEIIIFTALLATLYVFTLPVLTSTWSDSVIVGCIAPIFWLNYNRRIKIELFDRIRFGLVALMIDIQQLLYSSMTHNAQLLLDYSIPFEDIGPSRPPSNAAKHVKDVKKNKKGGDEP